MAGRPPGSPPQTTATRPGAATASDPVTARLRKRLRRVRRRLRTAGVDYFRGGAADWPVLCALALLVPLLILLNIWWPAWAPPTALVLPILAAALLLRPGSLVVLYALAALGLSAESVIHTGQRVASDNPEAYTYGVTPGAALVVGAAGVGGLLLAQFRSRVGVPWWGGSTMLFDLRERLRVQSRVPRLPDGWHADMALRPAGGQSFSGDFVVADRTGPGRRVLEVVLADVSGKGMDAGSRALLLSGAFGGLLGSLPAHDFLPAANGYLLRQSWEEGFATAVHLVLDLDTGEYELLSAGHLPGMQRLAGAGRWDLKEAADGPALGIYDGAKFEGVRGRLNRGDVLMLCTDGMVEAPGRDLSEGMDRLMGEADRLVPGSGPGTGGGAAARLIETVARDINDDRAVLLLWRD
ncbi:PP2C family protein-serine/threonine phosphatase [Streptomyces sp. BE20]|uniref:PP2C family protein-serine/threonine phosphatase n=1 Tax=Streptomycetaceae TaxID=2062 RepID=UPI002E77B10D|nr:MULTISPECIES: PP2C family protein-serine/threonine phosphatase [unclassified Streptomyces]MED7953250.1 PP2C family protein-serine/threonine phosphatase [Streptomyces sp. BE303]MEE1828599.1 PP2C family protein-serine/threonine phosphatase [Streptomyces sp. BE20]